MVTLHVGATRYQVRDYRHHHRGISTLVLWFWLALGILRPDLTAGMHWWGLSCWTSSLQLGKQKGLQVLAADTCQPPLQDSRWSYNRRTIEGAHRSWVLAQMVQPTDCAWLVWELLPSQDEKIQSPLLVEERIGHSLPCKTLAYILVLGAIELWTYSSQTSLFGKCRCTWKEVCRPFPCLCCWKSIQCFSNPALSPSTNLSLGPFPTTTSHIE